MLGRDFFRKKFKYIIICIVIILLVCFLYHGFIMRFIPPKVSEGIELYKNNVYLLFDDGEDFCDYLEKISWLDPDKADYFSYLQNARSDSLFRKVPDIYQLVYFNQPVEEVQQAFQSDGFWETEGLWSDYAYVMSPQITGGKYRLFADLEPETGMLRFIMITDTNWEIKKGYDLWTFVITFGLPDPK